MAWLIHAQPFDRSAAAQFTVRASFGLGADTRVDTDAWPALIVRLPSRGRSLPVGGGRTTGAGSGPSPAIIAGSMTPSFGQLMLAVPASDAARWRRAVWEGWPVTVYKGSGHTLAGYTVWALAEVEQASISDEVLTLSLRPSLSKLEQVVPAAVYAGTGGLQGVAEIKGQPIITILGQAKNYVPDVLDPATETYRLNAGSLSAITGVWDRLRALTYAGNYASLAALPASASMTKGTYVTSLADGVMRLAASPGDRGQITVTAQDASDLRVGEVFRRAALLAFSAGQIDSAAITALNTAYSPGTGLRIENQVKLRDLLDLLAITAEAVWGFTAGGLLTIRRVIDTSPVATITARTILPRPVRGAVRPPPERLDLGYDRSWRVFTQSEVGDVVVTNQGALATQESTLNLLYDSGKVTLANNILTKTGGTDGIWDSHAYSPESFIGGCAVAFQALQINEYFMVGLNSDPGADEHYLSLDFAWHPEGGGTAGVYLNGAGSQIAWEPYTTSTIFLIVHDGLYVRFYMDGVLKFTSSQTAPNLRLHLDSSFSTVGAAVKILHFGPTAGLWDVLRTTAVKTSEQMFETWSSYDAIARVYEMWNFGGDPTLITTSDAGGKALRFGNNSGDDSGYFIGRLAVAIDYSPEDVYVCEFDVEVEAYTSGNLYLGVTCLDVANDNISSDAGSYHYFAVATGSVSVGRQIYRGFFSGLASSGTGSPSTDPASPGACKTGTMRVAPMGLLNQGGGTGQVVVHSARVAKVFDNPDASQRAISGLNTDGTVAQNIPVAVASTGSNGVARPLGKGISVVRLTDGQSFTYPSSWSSADAPAVYPIADPYVDGTKFKRVQAQAATASGFTCSAKIITPGGSSSTVTETSISNPSDAPRVERITKGTATEAVDDTYKFTIDVVVQNKLYSTPYGSFYVSGRVVVGFWTHDGSSWQLHTTREYTGDADSSPVTHSNIEVSVVRDGMGSGDLFALSIESDLAGGSTVDFDATLGVRYSVATGESSTTATPSGHPGYDFLIVGGGQ